MNTMHLFAGAGGGLLGDLILGHNPICAVEWEKYPAETLRQRAKEGWFPNLEVICGDVREFEATEYKGRVDCIHAGFPCQDLSVAGKQKGIGEGTRSGLYREVLRVADVVRPEWLFLENSPAIIALGLGTVLADLAKRGYDAEWMCLSAAECGAPHLRDRWWLLAHSSKIGLRSEETKQELGRKLGPSERSVEDEWWGRDPADATSETQPAMGRVDNGVAHRVERVKAIGNGQVPLTAALAFTILHRRFLWSN
jgi:DNA (cytosine-5)-methyltransferase 1